MLNIMRKRSGAQPQLSKSDFRCAQLAVHFVNCVFVPIAGADLLKLSRDDFIQICGPADGIRLFNAIKGR